MNYHYTSQVVGALALPLTLVHFITREREPIPLFLVGPGANGREAYVADIIFVTRRNGRGEWRFKVIKNRTGPHERKWVAAPQAREVLSAALDVAARVPYPINKESPLIKLIIDNDGDPLEALLCPTDTTPIPVEERETDLRTAHEVITEVEELLVGVERPPAEAVLTVPREAVERSIGEDLDRLADNVFRCQRLPGETDSHFRARLILQHFGSLLGSLHR